MLIFHVFDLVPEECGGVIKSVSRYLYQIQKSQKLQY